jgi:phosphoketolase
VTSNRRLSEPPAEERFREGTTRFDITVMNELDRLHLAMDVLKRVPISTLPRIEGTRGAGD